MSAIRGPKAGTEDSFGFVGLSAVGSIMAVLILDNIPMTIFVDELIVLVKEIFISLLPLLIIFLIFQFIRLKLPKEQFLVIIRGIVLTFVGLVLFLLGIKVGFIRVGELIGQTLGTLDHNWILIPIGFLLGLLVTLAEPGVRILALEVEKVTGGYISRKIILYFLAIGWLCSCPVYV